MRFSTLVWMLVVTGLTFSGLGIMRAGADLVPRHDYYLTVAQGETTLFSSLEQPCASTGLHLVLYNVPSGMEVTQTGTTAGTRTCSCCPPPPGCCDQEFVVFSIRSDIPGQYDIEFRIGRGDASSEYYEVAVLHVTVTSSSADKSWHATCILFSGGLVVLLIVTVFAMRRR